MHVRTYDVPHTTRTHEDDYDCGQRQQSHESELSRVNSIVPIRRIDPISYNQLTSYR
jgi:hypothetical protein